MMPPNLLREAYRDLGHLVGGHDPMHDRPLPKRYPEGLNALQADHVASIVRGRILRPIERCRPWLDAKIQASANADTGVADLDSVLRDVSTAVDLLRDATKNTRDSVVQAIDEHLHGLHELLGPCVR